MQKRRKRRKKDDDDDAEFKLQFRAHSNCTTGSMCTQWAIDATRRGRSTYKYARKKEEKNESHLEEKEEEGLLSSMDSAALVPIGLVSSKL